MTRNWFLARFLRFMFTSRIKIKKNSSLNKKIKRLNHNREIPKTVFRATIIVAGTNKTNNAANIDVTISPIPIPIKEPTTLSIPNLLTITKTAPDNKNV